MNKKFNINISKPVTRLKLLLVKSCYLFKSLYFTIILSFSLMKMYIFAFFLPLGQWCHVCDKSSFQPEDNSRGTPRSDTNTNNNGGRREIFLLEIQTKISKKKIDWGRESKLYSVVAYKPTSNQTEMDLYFCGLIHPLACNQKVLIRNATDLKWQQNVRLLWTHTPCVSSDKQPPGDKLFKDIHWLIMCTDVKGGQ